MIVELMKYCPMNQRKKLMINRWDLEDNHNNFTIIIHQVRQLKEVAGNLEFIVMTNMKMYNLIREQSHFKESQMKNGNKILSRETSFGKMSIMMGKVQRRKSMLGKCGMNLMNTFSSMIRIRDLHRETIPKGLTTRQILKLSLWMQSKELSSN